MLYFPFVTFSTLSFFGYSCTLYIYFFSECYKQFWFSRTSSVLRESTVLLNIYEKHYWKHDRNSPLSCKGWKYEKQKLSLFYQCQFRLKNSSVEMYEIIIFGLCYAGQWHANYCGGGKCHFRRRLFTVDITCCCWTSLESFSFSRCCSNGLKGLGKAEDISRCASFDVFLLFDLLVRYCLMHLKFQCHIWSYWFFTMDEVNSGIYVTWLCNLYIMISC